MPLFTTDTLMIAMALLVLLNLGWSLAWPQIKAREDRKRRLNAAAVLKKHGLTNHLYLAGVGAATDELKMALNFFGDRGHIIMDSDDQIVGKVASSQASALEVASATKPIPNTKPTFLKLVVDNTSKQN